MARTAEQVRAAEASKRGAERAARAARADGGKKGTKKGIKKKAAPAPPREADRPVGRPIVAEGALQTIAISYRITPAVEAKLEKIASATSGLHAVSRTDIAKALMMQAIGEVEPGREIDAAAILKLKPRVREPEAASSQPPPPPPASAPAVPSAVGEAANLS